MLNCYLFIFILASTQTNISSNYLFCGYKQDNQECSCRLDIFLVSETIIVRLFQRNQDCYCDYFILIVFNQVRFRLRAECPGSLMSLYGSTFHVTPVDLRNIFHCNLYISCIMSCGKKIVSIVSNADIICISRNGVFPQMLPKMSNIRKHNPCNIN